MRLEVCARALCLAVEDLGWVAALCLLVAVAEDCIPVRLMIAPFPEDVIADDRTEATTAPVVLATVAVVVGSHAGSDPVTHAYATVCGALRRGAAQICAPRASESTAKALIARRRFPTLPT